MKKILLFSIVFVAASATAIAQKKASKSPKRTVVSVKSSEAGQAKTTVPKNPKQLDLQSTKVQPVNVPAALKDERAN